MRDKGKFFYKKRWFSLCSAHLQYNYECINCNTGTWKNVWRTNIEKVVFILSPKLYNWLLKFKKIQIINIKKKDGYKKNRRNQRKN